MEYTVNFMWDKDADVWIAQSDGIPGLILESGSFDALVERVRFAAPELIQMNNHNSEPFYIFFKSECYERIPS
jgi:hypothetical protein